MRTSLLEESPAKCGFQWGYLWNCSRFSSDKFHWGGSVPVYISIMNTHTHIIQLHTHSHAHTHT